MQPPVRLGSLTFESLDAHPELIATPVAAAARALEPRMRASIAVAEIDPALADTAAFCERYGVALDRSANCVVLACRREGRAWFAACVILATLRIDVNGIVKRHVRASKISFASMDAATAASAMEYGGITPLGLPPDWPILIDSAVAAAGTVVIGSGLRRSKVALPAEVLAQLPGAHVLNIAVASPAPAMTSVSG